MPSSVYLGRKRKSKTIYRPARFHHQSETRRVILNRVAVALKSRRFPSFSLTIARQYSFRSNDYMERRFSPIFTRASYLSIGLLPSSIQTNYFFETAITQVHWMKNHNILKWSTVCQLILRAKIRHFGSQNMNQRDLRKVSLLSVPG